MAKEAVSRKASTNISVNIDQVKNGYVVATHNNKTFKTTRYIEKTKATATERAAKLL